MSKARIFSSKYENKPGRDLCLTSFNEYNMFKMIRISNKSKLEIIYIANSCQEIHDISSPSTGRWTLFLLKDCLNSNNVKTVKHDKSNVFFPSDYLISSHNECITWWPAISIWERVGFQDVFFAFRVFFCCWHYQDSITNSCSDKLVLKGPLSQSENNHH